MPNFIPHSKANYYEFLLNLKTEVVKPEVAAVLPPDDVTTVAAKATNQLARHAATLAAKVAYDAALKDEADGKIETDYLLQEKNADWKRIAGFPGKIATKLQMVASSSTADVPAKVSFELKIVAGEVRVDWVKGPLQGINVYARLRGETTWVKIGWDTSSPYLDSRPLAQAGVAEVREYMLRGVIKDEEVTEDSDVKSIVLK